MATAGSAHSSQHVQRGVRRAAVKTAVLFVCLGALLFACAGSLRWLWGWCYLALLGGLQAVTTAALAKRDPDLLAERSGLQAGTKPWDKVLAPAVALFGPLLMVVTAGFDYRWSWSGTVQVWVHVAALLFAAAGGLIVTWAMLSNHFFAVTVRIQTDRGHRVIDQGPYRHVRHPGYSGAILVTLALPLLLGTLWAMIPAAAIAILFVLRTHLEDRTLTVELQGYAEYRLRVPSRLIPYLW